MRILLIDDNAVVLETVSSMLASDGHTVLTTSRARDGLARLETGEVVDLVLTNLTMPDIGGLEVVRRARVRWPHLKVGIITGALHQLPEQHPALDLLFKKPVALPELVEAVRRLRERCCVCGDSSLWRWFSSSLFRSARWPGPRR